MAVGGLPGLYYLPVLAAQQLGYFKDEGLDVTLEDFAGGSKALEAVVGAAPTWEPAHSSTRCSCRQKGSTTGRSY